MSRRPNKSIQFKSLFGIASLLILFSVIVALNGFHVFTKSTMEQYVDAAFQTADAAALAVNPNRMDEYMREEGDLVEYQTVYRNLDKLCNATGVTFIYVIQPDLTDYGHITFVFATGNKNNHYTLYEKGYVRETTNDDYRQKYRKLYEEGSDKELVVRDKGYIETDPHITAMIPLRSSSGETKAILCVQRQMDTMVAARKGYVNRVFVALVGMLVILFYSQTFFLRTVLLDPVKKITEEASRFASENVRTGKKLRETIQNQDEIGDLAGAIDQMEEQIHTYVENLTHITAERERIRTELSLAARIQTDMLPNTFPAFPDRQEFDIYASMDPAKEVGGDFYDFFLIDEDHLCISIADVSGKGIPAALFMMVAKVILANYAMQGKSPGEILEMTNEMICANNREEMFVTVWLGILEISTGKMTAANAGHEYPALRNAGGQFELLKDRHGFVIGGMDGMKYREYEFLMEPGAGLFLYTDGVPEATNAADELFGTERMLAALNKEPESSVETLLQNVRQAVDSFVGEAEQFDDLTMVGFTYLGRVLPGNEVEE